MNELDNLIVLRYGGRVLIPLWGLVALGVLCVYLIDQNLFGDVSPHYEYGIKFLLPTLTLWAIYYSLAEFNITSRGVSKRLRLLSVLGIGSHSINWASQPSISERPMPNDLYQIAIKAEGCTIKIESTMTGYENALDFLEEIGVLPPES